MLRQGAVAVRMGKRMFRLDGRMLVKSDIRGGGMADSILLSNGPDGKAAELRESNFGHQMAQAEDWRHGR